MSRARLLLLLLVLAAPSSAAANGGPVAFTEGTASGGLTPLAEEEITLTREDLVIRLDADGTHYDVDARYALSNAKAAKGVRYGVPLVWIKAGGEEGQDPEAAKRRSAAEASVRVAVGGKAVPACKIATGLALPSPPPFENTAPDAAVVQAWCVTEIDVPRGKSEVELTYRGELSFVDMGFSKSALTSYGARTLTYPLSPAGFWRGPVGRLTITLEAGVLAPFVKISSPTGARQGGTHFGWTLDQVDLKAVGALTAEIDAAPVLTSRDLSLWNTHKAAGLEVSVKASSTHVEAGHSYDAQNLLDGKLDTAWCEGAPGSGKGEWLELRVSGSVPPCALEGLAMVVGYAKSPTMFTANGRVRKVRVSVCGEPARKVEEAFEPLPSDPALAGRMIYFNSETGSLGLENGKDVCLRLEILEVAPGAKYQDTCVSELAPVINCG